METSVRTLGRLAVRCMRGQSPTTGLAVLLFNLSRPAGPEVPRDQATQAYGPGIVAVGLLAAWPVGLLPAVFPLFPHCFPLLATASLLALASFAID